MTTPRIVTIHRPDAVSGVSTVGARFARLPAPFQPWIPLVVGPESLSDEKSPLRECPGFSRVSWPDGTCPVKQCLLVRDRLRELAPDVVVPNDLPEGFVAAALNRHLGQRLAAWRHGDDHDWDEIVIRAWPLIDAWAAVNSAIVRRTLAAAPELGPHACILTGCVEVPPAPARITNGSSARATPLRLLYTGRVEKKHKRILDLVALCDELAKLSVPFVLTVAGDGPAAVEFAESAWAHVLAGRVNLLGPVPLSLIPRLVRASHMLVMTSHCEGAPASAMEALAQGRPVALSTGCGLVSEVVRDGVEGIIVPTGDMAMMARRLASIASDPAWLERASVAAHALAQRTFSPAALGPRAERFANAAVSSPQNTGPASPTPQRTWSAIVQTIRLLGEPTRHSLDELAAQWLAEQSLPGAQLTVEPPPLPSREGRRLLGVLERLQREGVRRIALYGAGWHTRKLLRTLESVPDIVAIVDDRAGEEGGPPALMASRPVVKPSAASQLKLDAIVISSDEHEREMLTRAKSWARNVPVHPLYNAA